MSEQAGQTVSGWRPTLVGLACLVTLLAGCATQGYAEKRAERTAWFREAAGEPVSNFRFWRLDRWEAVNRSQVAVWARPDEGYLLDLDEPCPGLEFADFIGLTSQSNRVQSRFDSVLFEDQKCRIREIRPIDSKRLKEVRRQADAAR